MWHVTERELANFRKEHLHPRALLAEVLRRVQVLAQVPLGVGKSFAADLLLQAPETYEQFRLVIYVAPTWAVIRERAIVAGRAVAPVPFIVLEPRPAKRCGPLQERWSSLEKAGCIALAKHELCKVCSERALDDDPCTWPDRFRDLDKVRLMFTTEAQLQLNRRLIPFLLQLVGSGRALVVFDEAVFLDGSFEESMAPEELDAFGEALSRTDYSRADDLHRAEDWLAQIQDLRSCGDADLHDLRLALKPLSSGAAVMVQRRGLELHGSSFRYLGSQLQDFAYSQAHERWRDPASGAIRFISRPYLRHHLLLLAAHLDPDYVGHRLGTGRMYAPFADLRVEHTKTKAFNLRSWAGSDRRFSQDPKPLLDVFAVLLLRNIREGRTTVLVSRKKSKSLVARYLEKRLAGWNAQVRFVTQDYATLSPSPQAGVVPIIHYGMRGQNDFELYETAYAVNSYYVPDSELNARLQEFEPEAFRVRLKIVEEQHRTRTVVLDQADVEDLDRTALGNIYLWKLEVEPALQAVGRVRYLSRPREVVFFTLHDLSRQVPNLREVSVPGMLLRELGLPTAAELDRHALALRARHLRASHLTADQIAEQLGVSKRTVFRLLRVANRAKPPLPILIGPVWHELGPIEAGGQAS